MTTLIISFLVSFIFSLLILRYSHLHGHISFDHDKKGVQKFHSFDTPRIGGLPIFIGIAFSIAIQFFQELSFANIGLILILSSLPVFILGLLEDVTKKISASYRLLAAFISAFLACYFLNTWLTNIQFMSIDLLLKIAPISMLFTCFAVAGVTHSVNLIDGFHGIASMIGIFILSAIVYVAFKVSDVTILMLGISVIGAILGFFVLNYPKGLIFLGDSGAYLIGFWIALLSLLLVSRHEEVSDWFPFLLCFYPIFETFFTVFRRYFIKRTSPGLPDSFHLHQLIYKRVLRWIVVDKNDKNKKNSMTAPYLWTLSLISIIPAILFWKSHQILKIFALIFALCYLWLYGSIVRFKTPKFMIKRK